MMRRRSFLLSSLALLARPLAGEAQPAGRVPRIGWLSLLDRSSPRGEAFSQGLREVGYVEGLNTVIEYRSADGMEDRLPTLAAELARLKVDVIVALEPPAARAAKSATKTIPVVIITRTP
jgi:putative ABC transport system substrate-binding protein